MAAGRGMTGQPESPSRGEPRPFPPRRGAVWERGGGSARRARGGHFVSLGSVGLVRPLRLRREELGRLLSV